MIITSCAVWDHWYDEVIYLTHVESSLLPPSYLYICDDGHVQVYPQLAILLYNNDGVYRHLYRRNDAVVFSQHTRSEPCYG